MSLPYFRQEGWEPVVLAVDSAAVESAVDDELAKTVPDIVIRRVGALPARWTRFLGLGNIGYRAWFQLNKTGRELLRSGSFDLVYFSTTQFIVTALGRRWYRDFGVPFVIDIQDPWRTDYYDRPGAPPPPGGWKYRLARWQAARLEERSWRDAAGFISVSEVYLEQLRGRYVWFKDKPAVTIPFGAPEADFVTARENKSIPIAFKPEPGILYLLSVGAIGQIMRPALYALFSGLARFRGDCPLKAARIRVIFVGTSYAPPGRELRSVEPLAVEHGVGDLVSEEPARIGYLASIKTMLAADALFLPGSDDPGYSPSKIGACFLAHRPVLAVAPEGSAAALRIASLGLANVIYPGAADGPARIAHFLHQLTSGLASNEGVKRAETAFRDTATAEAVTRQQSEFFSQAVRASK